MEEGKLSGGEWVKYQQLSLKTCKKCDVDLGIGWKRCPICGGNLEIKRIGKEVEIDGADFKVD